MIYTIKTDKIKNLPSFYKYVTGERLTDSENEYVVIQVWASATNVVLEKRLMQRVEIPIHEEPVTLYVTYEQSYSKPFEEPIMLKRILDTWMVDLGNDTIDTIFDLLEGLDENEG